MTVTQQTDVPLPPDADPEWVDDWEVRDGIVSRLIWSRSLVPGDADFVRVAATQFVDGSICAEGEDAPVVHRADISYSPSAARAEAGWIIAAADLADAWRGKAEPRDECAPWCAAGDHAEHDSACWGRDRIVSLSLEEGFPVEAIPDSVDSFDPPRVGAYPYRARPGYREVVYLHVYRPSDNDHLALDSSVHLTPDEAVRLAHVLLAAADDIESVIDQ